MSYYDGYVHASASAVTVLISASGQPELNRIIELPGDAPDAWLANAFLLSIGENPLADDDAEDFRLPQAYGPLPWGSYGRSPLDDEANLSRSFTLPGVPHELEVHRLHTRAPSVGEPNVAIIEQDDPDPTPVSAARDRTSASTAPANVNWQTSAASLSVREVNMELADQYGVVQPRFDHSLVVDLGHGVSSGCLLVELLRALPPVRRLALRSHLRETGLLDRPVFSEADAAALSDGLRALIDRIGSNGLEQSENGWLSDDALRDVEQVLGWTSELQVRLASARGSDVSIGASLLSTARELRLVRRLKGRIVLTSVAKALRARPDGFVLHLAHLATHGAGQSGYHRPEDSHESQMIIALALLSIADGSAQSRADVVDVVARGVAVLERRAALYGDYGTEHYWHEYPGGDALFSENNISSIIDRTLDRLEPPGRPESFIQFAPAVRRLAHAALL